VQCDTASNILDRSTIQNYVTGAANVTLPDPDITAGCGNNFYYIPAATVAVTINRGTNATLTIFDGTNPVPTGQTSYSLGVGKWALVSNTNFGCSGAACIWSVLVGSGSGGGGGTVTTTGSPVNGNLTKFTGATTISNGDLSGDVTTSGTLATTVTKINGTTVPTSAAVLGTDGSAKPIAATAHGVSTPLNCSDTSGSGASQSCSTAPSFSPAKGDALIYYTTTSNTGALTLNVNAAGAVAVQKWSGTALNSGDIAANKPNTLIYDGSNWQLQNLSVTPSELSIVTKAGNYTLTATDGTILCNGTITLTLPTTGIPTGKKYVVKYIASGGTCTISSAVNIDAATSTTLTTQYSALALQWDGTQWWKE
jgi:hypothetical protein